MPPLEVVADGDTPLAYFLNPAWLPEQTTFLTPDDFGQQMGMIVYGAGEAIPAHVHLPIVREVHGTTECVIVRKGRCAIDIYTSERKLVATRELEEGSIVLLLGGGHGFRMHEDTVLFEVKQGPYVGNRDKERF
jgi:hypothetical protein